MKVVYIKDFTGHIVGHVINTDPSTANFLINKGVCEEYIEPVAEKLATVIKKEIAVNTKQVVTRGRKPKKK